MRLALVVAWRRAWGCAAGTSLCVLAGRPFRAENGAVAACWRRDSMVRWGRGL